MPKQNLNTELKLYILFVYIKENLTFFILKHIMALIAYFFQYIVDWQ